jgi:hypothetical protein
VLDDVRPRLRETDGQQRRQQVHERRDVQDERRAAQLQEHDTRAGDQSNRDGRHAPELRVRRQKGLVALHVGRDQPVLGHGVDLGQHQDDEHRREQQQAVRVRGCENRGNRPPRRGPGRHHATRPGPVEHRDEQRRRDGQRGYRERQVQRHLGPGLADREREEDRVGQRHGEQRVPRRARHVYERERVDRTVGPDHPAQRGRRPLPGAKQHRSCA